MYVRHILQFRFSLYSRMKKKVDMMNTNQFVLYMLSKVKNSIQ